ncbi:MAG TPA: T9SS type A sorting domain-containing protein [Ignavibacteria bacterium]|nr:T9SS type A sorting domain-containing protein [Ignavibacteria bacterium]
MKSPLIYAIVFILVITLNQLSQNRFRSGMFFHHSTGECIWGPNGSSTSVPQEMTRYNNQHGYSGQNSVTMNEIWFPVNYDNEWATWHTIFESGNPENIAGYFNSNKIIMVKSCFPSSAIEAIGEPIDTISPEYKTVYNYKWHWRHIINVMKNRPQNFFVIWTNAPLTPLETTPTQAYLSKQFCKWAKDTLAKGLDPVYGTFPNNVYVFCLFSKLTDANGYMLLQYATGPNDPHPNAAATALVAPQLVDEVFDHSIAYEQIFGIKKLGNVIPEDFILYQNYPNPFNPQTKIRFEIPKVRARYIESVQLIVYDILGQKVATLVNEQLSPGTYEVEFDGEKEVSGIYFYALTAGDYFSAKKMLLIK